MSNKKLPKEQLGSEKNEGHVSKELFQKVVIPEAKRIRPEQVEGLSKPHTGLLEHENDSPEVRRLKQKIPNEITSLHRLRLACVEVVFKRVPKGGGGESKDLLATLESYFESLEKRISYMTSEKMWEIRCSSIVEVMNTRKEMSQRIQELKSELEQQENEVRACADENARLGFDGADIMQMVMNHVDESVILKVFENQGKIRNGMKAIKSGITNLKLFEEFVVVMKKRESQLRSEIDQTSFSIYLKTRVKENGINRSPDKS